MICNPSLLHVAFGLMFWLAYAGWSEGGAKDAAGAKPLRLDQHGDPLPEGVLARMGTVRFHHPGGIAAAAYSPDGKTIVAVGFGAKGHLVRFWDATSGKETGAINIELASNLRQPAISPDGKTLALGTDQAIELLNIKTGKRLRSLAPDVKGTISFVSFAFSPDGKTLAAGCWEGKDNNPIRVWDVATGRELAPFPGFGTSFNAVAFSADGKRLFCGPTQGGYGNEKKLGAAICVWDVATRTLFRRLDRQDWNIVFAPSGAMLGYENDGIHVISVATGKEICKIAGNHAFFSFAPDSKTILALDQAKNLRELDAVTGKELRRFDGEPGESSRLVGISQDGKRLAVMDGGWRTEGVVRQWDMATGKEIRLYSAHADEVSHLAYSPDGKLLASGSNDRTIRLWDPATGKLRRILEGHRGEVCAVAFSSDGKTLASSSLDGTTRLWDVATGRQLAAFENPNAQPMGMGGMGMRFHQGPGSVALSFAPDGKTLFAAGANGMLAAWDWRARKEIQRKVLQKDWSAHPVFLPNLGAVLTAGTGATWEFDERADEPMRLWSLSTGKAIQEINLLKTRENWYSLSCTGLAAAPDERMLVSSQVLVSQSLRGPRYHDPVLCLWERVTGREILRIKDAMSAALAFSPDSRLLAVDDGGVTFFAGRAGAVSQGAHISLWDTLTGERLSGHVGHTAQVRCLAFAPDGKSFASASADHTILIWTTPPFKQPKADALTPAQIEHLWGELGKDAPEGHKAAAQLVFHPAAATALIRTKLPPAVPLDPMTVASRITDLDSAQYPVREKAIRQLEAMEDLAEPHLQAALADRPTVEKRRRLQYLLAKAAIHSSRQVHNLRALTVLERIASSETRQLLASLARGTPDARLTREAQASLRRIGAEE
jgi:WD40 repeat protein